MGKKSLDRKAAREFINVSRENGRTDQEIYEELAQKYYDKKTVAVFITATVTQENKKKYKVYNNILIGLLGLSIVSKILAVLSLTIDTGQIWALLLIFIVPLFAGYFMYEISRYNAGIYRFCGLMAILGLLQSMGKTGAETDVLVNVIFTIAVAGLSFFLDNKMFPKFSPNNLKKDSGGEYILD